MGKLDPRTGAFPFIMNRRNGGSSLRLCKAGYLAGRHLLSHFTPLQYTVMDTFTPIIWKRKEMDVQAGLIAQTAVPYLLRGKISRLVLTQKLLFGPRWLRVFSLWYFSQRHVFSDNNSIFCGLYLTMLNSLPPQHPQMPSCD